MWLDILIALGNKFLPEIIKKFIPLVQVQPKKISFNAGEWTSNFVFFLHNRAKQVLFDVYLLIEVGCSKTEDFKILKTDVSKDLKIPIGNIEVNSQILRLDCFYVDNEKDFIVLKLKQINPGSFVSFEISAATKSNLKFKVLKYSKEQSGVLNKSNGLAVPFEVPLNKKIKFQLKNAVFVLNRNPNFV